MNRLIRHNILRPFAGRWSKGLLLLLLWTAVFIALPALAGWFLAMCSIAFITANLLFAYIIPATLIQLVALVRTTTRYFERVKNHKTTLEVQRQLQLNIFRSVAQFSFHIKRSGKTAALLETTTQGIDGILNHVLLWILPFTSLIVSLGICSLLLAYFSSILAIVFILSSAVLLFVIPQSFYRKNRKIYRQLTECREENNRQLIQSFRGRIELSKYHLEKQVIGQYQQRTTAIERLASALQNQAFLLQVITGLGFSFLAGLLFWLSYHESIGAPLAIGIFFGILAQTELAEMLFSGKSEKSSVDRQIESIDEIFQRGEQPIEPAGIHAPLEIIILKHIEAQVPETTMEFPEISISINKGEWVAIFGSTGQGKTTLLNSLFYPEYRKSGTILWNGSVPLPHLPVPQCIYVTQQAFLLTGTLRDNFEGHTDKTIERVLEIVDLTEWYASLPNGMRTWIGENGETLSGGQRKKLLLAQALLKQPQLLVVDEPTAGIDTETAINLFQTIKERFPDLTVLMATHLNPFEKMVDKVVRI